MTVKQIQDEHNQQNTIHDVAKQIVELLDQVKTDVDKLGGDGDAARDRVIELVTED